MGKRVNATGCVPEKQVLRYQNVYERKGRGRKQDWARGDFRSWYRCGVISANSVELQSKYWPLEEFWIMQKYSANLLSPLASSFSRKSEALAVCSWDKLWRSQWFEAFYSWLLPTARRKFIPGRRIWAAHFCVYHSLSWISFSTCFGSRFSGIWMDLFPERNLEKRH